MHFRRNIYFLPWMNGGSPEFDTGMEFDATEWHIARVEKAAPVKKANSTVESVMAGGCGLVERKDGGQHHWSAVEREDTGRSSAVKSAAAVWSRWSTPRRCGHVGAVWRGTGDDGLTSRYGWRQVGLCK
jgi:hypothetical protein